MRPVELSNIAPGIAFWYVVKKSFARRTTEKHDSYVRSSDTPCKSREGNIRAVPVSTIPAVEVVNTLV